MPLPKNYTISSNRLHYNMLGANDFLTALNANIHTLRSTLNNNSITITEVHPIDHFYTDGATIGAFFKINPFNFYYDRHGIPSIGCWGADWELYGVACNEWVTQVTATALAASSLQVSSSVL